MGFNIHSTSSMETHRSPLLVICKMNILHQKTSIKFLYTDPIKICKAWENRQSGSYVNSFPTTEHVMACKYLRGSSFVWSRWLDFTSFCSKKNR